MKNIVMSVLLLCLCGCTHMSAASNHPDYPEGWLKEQQIKELKNNWEDQSKKDVVVNSKWENCADIKIPDQSFCGGHKLDVYELIKASAPYSVTAVAYYCSSEKKYWIKEEGGDYKYQCRILGPFYLSESK